MVKFKITLVVLISTLFLHGCSGNGSSGHRSKQVAVMAARSEVSSLQAEPTNLVLMLPLKGELAASSQAIRNGFLAAYYAAQPEHPTINVKVIDTTNADVPALYQQAVIDGAEVVVGPLTKKEVEAVMTINPVPIPILALNTLDNYAYNFGANVYQFGLLPQDEARQVAIKMLREQHDRVAIIAPNDAWGNKIVAAFSAQYVEQGGQVVAALNYNPSLNLAAQLCHFLAADATQLCVPKKHRNKKQEATSDLMRRQDINAIFLVAQAPIARQIVPLLKFYYAGDLATYSISAIYTGIPRQNLDQDLDGVHFCDMPWVLHHPTSFDSRLQAIHKQVTTLWADSYTSYSRLYALGIDAYTLAAKLYEFLHSPQYGVDGASGRLYLDEFNHIYRALHWATMQHGLPVCNKE